MRHSLLAALASALTLAIAACGESKPEPATPAAPQSGASDTPSDTSSLPATSPPVTSNMPPPPPQPDTAPIASTTPPADAGAGSAPPKPNGAVVGESKDECTPVGVDFEKRARPKLKECYAEGKKKDANLQGTVKIKVTVDVKGKIKSTKITEKTLPDPVAECMLKVVKSTPFPEVDKCWDSTILLPITFPTPH